jgi:tetratricopeptide (TPR) repeat protein
MSVKVASNRFIASSLKGFYRCLTHHLSNFQALGERLIHEAETAQAFRQTERLEEVGLILSNLPIKEYQLIGQYYIGWSINRKGGDAQKLLEQVAEESTTYRPRALIDLGSMQTKKGEYTSSIAYYTEALKYSRNPYTIIQAERSIAAAKGVEGFHGSAIKDLERIAPLFRYSPPIERCQYLNSLAVELSEVGMVEEAKNICRILLASHYAFAYPEWRETGEEIALRGYKSRSSVSITQAYPGNLLFLPDREASDTSIQSELSGPAPVFNLEKWKEEKMVKEPNGEPADENVDEMDDKDLLATLIQVAAQEDIDEENLRDVVKYAIRKLGVPKKR